MVVAKKSTHENGEAVDIAPTRMKIPDLLKMAANFFDSIGIAKTFLHLDIRRDKKPRRWDY